jgi:hypothetical protein
MAFSEADNLPASYQSDWQQLELGRRKKIMADDGFRRRAKRRIPACVYMDKHEALPRRGALTGRDNGPVSQTALNI